MEKQFSLQMIREKSKSFQVPYENMLIGCAKERILDRFLNEGKTPEKETYVFSGVVGLGIERYRYSKDRTLELKVPAETLTETHFNEFKKFGCTEEDGGWQIRWIKKESAEAVLEIEVPFEKIRIPITLIIAASQARKGVTQKVSLPLCYENDRYLEIPCFYPEAELAEAFVEFWERLELIWDISHLEYMYLMGKTFALDGRRLSEYLDQSLRAHNMTVSTERCAQVFACEKNAHLKKRWKSYLSKEKRREPQWEEVMETIENLYEPVVQMLCKEEIFFGDWMPAVGRYL